MIYQEFLRAAHKHLSTCEVLKEALKNIPNKEEQNKIVLNLYYLTGYIIECSVKYAIYDLLGHPVKEDIQTLSREGISFEKHLRRHPVSEYSEILSQRARFDIPLIKNEKNINKNVLKLYRRWDTPVRYETKRQFKNNTPYLEFLEKAKEVYQVIHTNLS